MKFLITIMFGMIFPALFAQQIKREMIIRKKYLNLPIESSQKQQKMVLKIPGHEDRDFVIRLSEGRPDYWVFNDVSDFLGKTIEILYPQEVEGINDIYQSDEIEGADSLYKERNRPQFHFTTKRGWTNDPNGLVYYKGEYHLFYQHNPYERKWENMHWGHAVSKDLLHWTELPIVLYPDKLGVMASGSAVVDISNTSGFQSGKEALIVAAYTCTSPDKQVQCIAYSNDCGRTFTKYTGNPVIDSKEKWNTINSRDPKIFWHKETNRWIMALYEKTGISFYNSFNLKDWFFQSHIGGFIECPELFELAVDGNPKNKKWVLYGAAGTYLIGSFDGKTFTSETDKLCYFRGNMYAAQTYNNVPDGRRIQIGWGQIEQKGMPFNQMMLFPTELSLRSTRDGIRMFSEPIREIGRLHGKVQKWENLSSEELNEKLKSVRGNTFHIKMRIKLEDGGNFQFLYNGNPILTYSIGDHYLNNAFYGGDKIEDLTFYYEVLIDKTSIELFADHGKFSIISPQEAPKNGNGFEFNNWSKLLIEDFEIYEIKSIWE